MRQARALETALCALPPKPRRLLSQMLGSKGPLLILTTQPSSVPTP
jgi:hypothetical protein